MAQYFYPQRLTKVMNEGTATFVHYAVMNRLHETGRSLMALIWSFSPRTPTS